MLANAGFENGFYKFQNIGELEVATGWEPWYLENVKSPGGAVYHRPEYKPEKVGVGKGRVHSGTYGQKQFTTYSSHDGGLRQNIDTEKGKWYRFSAWVYVWSSEQDNADISKCPGRYRAMVGANPWADWAKADTTIWGEEIIDKYDQWMQVQVIFQAWHTRAALYTRGNPWYGPKHNDSYWDNIELVQLVEPGTEPGPSVPVDSIYATLQIASIHNGIASASIEAAMELLKPPV